METDVARSVMTERQRCPACGALGVGFRSSSDVAHDIAQTEAAHRSALKLMHRDGARIDGCSECGTLWRADESRWRSAVRSYRDDHYPPRLLGELYRAERHRYTRDRRWLAAHGVVPGAVIVEVGSYVGGLLSYAAACDATAIGVDPNPQLARWGQFLGLDVRLGTVEQAHLPAGEFDGVWVLNCFEQVPEPHALLAEARRLVRPGGRLVLRTPNATFLRRAYEERDGRRPSIARQHALWGMPHLCCYTVGAIDELLRRHRFSVDSVRASDVGDTRWDGKPDEAPWIDLSARAC